MTANASGKERYVVQYGSICVPNPDKTPGADSIVYRGVGETVELTPHDAARINTSEGIRLDKYMVGKVEELVDEDGNPTGETKNVPDFVKDTRKRLGTEADLRKQEAIDAQELPAIAAQLNAMRTT